MPAIYEDNEIIGKTRGLCQAIIDAPEFVSIRERISAFMTHDQAQAQYDQLNNLGGSLQQKQSQGVAITDAEIAHFEQQRQELLDNPVARGFLEAQEELHEVKKLVTKYVTKTLELGRVPETTELDHGHCGAGCGCH